jgi:hypothetical protein
MSIGAIGLAVVAAIYFTPFYLAITKKKWLLSVLALVGPVLPLAASEAMPNILVWILASLIYCFIFYKIIEKKRNPDTQD